jgi:hypothetical protein
LLTVDETLAALKKASSIKYRPPGKKRLGTLDPPRTQRYCFFAVEEAVGGFGCMTENCDRLPVGFAFACFGFFFSRLLLS